MRTPGVVVVVSLMGGLGLAASALACSASSDDQGASAENLAVDPDHRDAGAPAGTVLEADISVIHATSVLGQVSDQLTVGVYRQALPGSTAGCEIASAGPSCTYSHCVESPTIAAVESPTAPIPNAGIDVTALSKGTISLHDAAGKASIVLGADAGQAAETLNWSPLGGELSVSATGSLGGLGPFHLTLPEPDAIAFTNPPPVPPPSGNYAPFALSRTADFDLAWTPGATGAEVRAVFSVDHWTEAGVDQVWELSCQFSQADGHGTVPSAGGLAQLPGGAYPLYSSILVLQTYASKTITVAGGKVSAGVIVEDDNAGIRTLDFIN